MVTGFEPFRQWRVNSSWEAVRRLRPAPDLAIHCLPVGHREAAREIERLIAKIRPDRVLLTGLADRPVPTLELQARLGPSLTEASEPTRVGRWPFDLSLDAMHRYVIPSRLSSDAGRYVCETTYWAALGTQTPDVAFLHLPPIRGAWTAQRLTRAVTATLATGRARVGGPAGW
ncbi:MAG: hypothetical protein AAGC79_18460 [Pseudomonadota bacterium]